MKGPNHIKEKRKHPRVNIDLPLEYRALDAPHLHGAIVINISESGLLVDSVKNLPIGTQLNIAVLFPKEFELDHFEILAEIVWKDKYWEENLEKYKFGLKFLHLSEEDQQKLNQVLAEEHER
jgi:c-di-GMP-binding flagellar brake protein YcgR